MAKIKFRTPVQVFRKWIKELRSGNYKQTTCQLRDVHGKSKSFCCLGVLCDIAAKDGGPKWDDNDMSDIAINSTDETPPFIMINYLGLTDKMINILIEMNDDDGATFDEIADEIEFNIMPALGLK